MRTNLEPFAMVPRDLIAAVKPRSLQVWCCLAQWSDAEDRLARPTIGRIASELGISRAAVDRALADLCKTGRLIRESGQQSGKRNEYTLVLSKRKQGGYGKNEVGGNSKTRHPHKGSTKNLLTKNPPTPASGGVAGVDDDQNFTAFWQFYPRHDKQARALGVWLKLTEAEQDAATAAAAHLAQCYEAATDDRRRFTQYAHNWLADRGWEADRRDVEAHYEVVGLIADPEVEAQRADAKQRQKAENDEIARLLRGEGGAA